MREQFLVTHLFLYIILLTATTVDRTASRTMTPAPEQTRINTRRSRCRIKQKIRVNTKKVKVWRREETSYRSDSTHRCVEV